jgi:hypothetical protein
MSESESESESDEKEMRTTSDMSKLYFKSFVL